MKKVLLLSAIVLWAFTLNAQDLVFDVAPKAAYVPVDTTPSANFPYHTVFNWHYSTNPTGVSGGTVGAMYFNNLYYLNRWNSTMLFRYNGGLLGPTSLADSATYQGSIRDLTTDGTFLYGGPATATVHKMNAQGISQGTITATGGASRAIAYSPDENLLFMSNFSDDVKAYAMTGGAAVRTLAGTAALSGKYGMAYSNIPGDVPALWVWGQGTSADPFNNLWKLNPQTGAQLALYRFGPLPVNGTTVSGIAGGAEIVQIDGQYVLLLNFQNYALAGYSMGVVPVELTSFTASSANNEVVLNWRTATELNNKGFEVEKNVNGSWNAIGFVTGKGTTTELQAYNFVDKSVEAGKSYSYRLKQVDFDGTSEYSNEISVEVVGAPAEFSMGQNYPNPFNPSTKINFTLAVDSKVKLTVFNAIGQEIASVINGNLSSGAHNVVFDASNLNSGVYIYKLEANGIDGSNFSSIKKMILTK